MLSSGDGGQSFSGTMTHSGEGRVGLALVAS